MEDFVYRDMARLEQNHWWFVGRRKILDTIVNRTLHSSGATSTPRILEIGAGTGGNHDLLSRYGATNFVEMEPLARDFFKQRFPAANLTAGKLPNDLAFAPEQNFDLICLFDVLEHIEDEKASLARIKSLLAPGGNFILTVPAYQFLFSTHDKLNHHHRRYHRAQLKALLVNSGFHVEKISYINMLLLPLALVVRAADQLFKNKKSSGASMPSPFVNYIMSGLFGVESKVLPYINLPCGLSLLVVATNKKT